MLSSRPTLHNYSKELQKIALKLFTWMAVNLGIEPHKLTYAYEDCNQGIRMNYYPPCVHADKVIGPTPHSDATGLTLLVQINEVQGLQIRKDGKWVPIEPVSGAIIVNIGDILEVMNCLRSQIYFTKRLISGSPLNLSSSCLFPLTWLKMIILSVVM